MTTTTNQTGGYLCKNCGAESPAGIGYAGKPEASTPAADCQNPHA